MSNGVPAALGGICTFAAALRPDFRRRAKEEDPRTTCRRCGTQLYVLPEDRRLGYCFDCFNPSDVRAATY